MMSMTGFGQGSASRDGHAVRVELSAVNRKNLDINTTLPRAYAAWEAHGQSRIQKALHRGRIQVRVEILTDNAATGLAFDAARAKDMLEQANRFAADHQLKPVDAVADLLRFALTVPDEQSAAENLRDLLDTALTDALDELLAMRAREGAHLAEVLAAQLDQLEALLREIDPLIEPARNSMIDKLRDSVQALNVDLADAQPRLLQEIALYGERSDIREETDRIQGHIQQAREKIKAEGPCGRALDFLCQELGRELNTLSVKAASSEINRLALAGKEQLEMIREQAQNVE
ncbi:MAG: YicC family protein [Verrucomicrobia bacterium]|nr:YicC family protein [Verrucomicrobiota bacterium]MCH8527214.1 YicC family protein [Kiritimatiellia bacterium]